MEILNIRKDKEDYMDMLLIGDEDEVAIKKYIDKSHIYILDDQGIKSIIALVEIDQDTIEVKNLATLESARNMGYASGLLTYVEDRFKDDYEYIILGTGETEKNLEFYRNRGYKKYGRLENFFILNYSRPIIDGGVKLKDMILFKKKL